MPIKTTPSGLLPLHSTQLLLPRLPRVTSREQKMRHVCKKPGRADTCVQAVCMSVMCNHPCNVYSLWPAALPFLMLFFPPLQCSSHIITSDIAHEYLTVGLYPARRALYKSSPCACRHPGQATEPVINAGWMHLTIATALDQPPPIQDAASRERHAKGKTAISSPIRLLVILIKHRRWNAQSSTFGTDHANRSSPPSQNQI